VSAQTSPSRATTGGLDRLRAVLPGIWSGMLLTVAFVAGAALFPLLERGVAGMVAGRMFAWEARISLAFAVVLFVIERRRALERAERGEGSRLSTELVLLLGVLFCVVAGYFALQPMMEAARSGQGSWSFGTLHAVSTVFYGLRTLLVLVLALRAARG